MESCSRLDNSHHAIAQIRFSGLRNNLQNKRFPQPSCCAVKILQGMENTSYGKKHFYSFPSPPPYSSPISSSQQSPSPENSNPIFSTASLFIISTSVFNNCSINISISNIISFWGYVTMFRKVEKGQ